MMRSYLLTYLCRIETSISVVQYMSGASMKGGQSGQLSTQVLAES